MNDIQKKVWAVAESHQLTCILEYMCGDFEAFCEGLRDADEKQMLDSIVALTNAV